MKRPLISASLFVLTALTARCDLQVPAFTAYIEPNPNGATVSKEGITNWHDNTNRVVWYGEMKHAGDVACAVTLHLPAGATSRLRLTVARQYRDVQAVGAADGTATANFGSFHFSMPGYQGFVLQSLNAAGAPIGDVESLTLGGEASEGAHFNMLPRRNAASVHLAYVPPAGARVAAFYCEATGVETPVWTYIMVCGWARGYLGMQVNSPTERRIIFSVWDAGSEPVTRTHVESENRTMLVAKGEGVQAGDFGNEGTGGHSHLVYPWRTGEKQRFLVTSRPVDATHTIFSGYYFHPDKRQWMLIASWNAPLTVGWLNGIYSFSENFGGANGELRRKALYGNQWIMTDAGKWVDLNTTTFSCDDTGQSSRFDRFMGVEDGQFFLSQGGYMPGFTAFGTKFQRPAIGQPPADVVELVAHPPMPATPAAVTQ